MNEGFHGQRTNVRDRKARSHVIEFSQTSASILEPAELSHDIYMIHAFAFVREICARCRMEFVCPTTMAATRLPPRSWQNCCIIHRVNSGRSRATFKEEKDK